MAGAPPCAPPPSSPLTPSLATTLAALWAASGGPQLMIHSGSLTAGATVVGVGMTLANRLLSWPAAGCLPLFSAWLDRTTAMSL